MRTEQLLYFLEIAKTGSMSLVAEKFYTSQPVVSTAITRLEEELNVKLLNRSNRGVRLTEAGQLAEKAFQQIEKSYDDLNKQLEVYREIKPNLQEGIINISSTVEVASTLLTSAMNRFYVKYPNCVFITNEYDLFDVIKNVGKSKSELGLFSVASDILIMTEIQQELTRYSLIIEKLTTDKLMAYVGSKSPLANKSVISLKTLLQEPVVIYNSSQKKCWQDL
ncbi:MAG: hypothetical protein H6Q64_25, partial [Firmicutes bacterium]|nr:hypothetical protein [Bacillota bacterium]